MSILAGARLGPYEIVAPLGAGGMGEVYRARDERLDREVAVKVLPASYSADADRLRRFEQEARAAGRLNHPNVLAIYDVGSHDGAPYVVSELLEGGTLRERLAGASMPLRKAIDYALQTARGLGAAHEKGIVHRDLKPENIFVTNDGRVKILDFGLAKLTRPETSGPMTAAPTETRGTEPGIVLGTVGYMSPEQVRGQTADARSDIFALGTILYEMLSGRRAFRGDSAADVMSVILREEPPPLAETGRNIPAPLERLVSHCLEKNPEERFQSARDIAYDLEALSGLSPSAVGAAPGLAKRPPRRVSVALAVVGALVTAAAGLFLGRASRPDRSAPPAFHQLTFRRGSIGSARFAPDGQSVVYSARWNGNPAQLFLQRPETPDAFPLTLPHAEILAISPSGEMALALDCRITHNGVCAGTLARAPLTGGSPRPIEDNVQDADWTSDGSAMALVHEVGGRARLEYPAGKVLYETGGHISYPRISPKGDRIAFFDHPLPIDDKGSVAVVDLAGRKTTLAGPFGSGQGLAWHASGKEVWFTASRSGIARSLFAASLSGRLRTVLAVTGGLTLRDISRAGQVLISQDSERTSIFARAPGETQERDLSWLDWSLPVDLSDDGKTLLLEEEGTATGPNYMVCVRKTDGSPPVRLGEGQAGALSPDGSWVLASPPKESGEELLLPVGPGQPRPLPHPGLQRLLGSAWSPDGKRVLLTAREVGKKPRLYLQEIAGGPPRPVTPEGIELGTVSKPISPDGHSVVALDLEQRTWIFPLDGGEAHTVAAIAPGKERPIRWGADGDSLFIRDWQVVPVHISRLELASGRRSPWKVLQPADPAGVYDMTLVRLSSDGQSYAYSSTSKLSDLYVVDGLK